mgnify:CR=1 FL=1
MNQSTSQEEENGEVKVDQCKRTLREESERAGESGRERESWPLRRSPVARPLLLLLFLLSSSVLLSSSPFLSLSLTSAGTRPPDRGRERRTGTPSSARAAVRNSVCSALSKTCSPRLISLLQRFQLLHGRVKDEVKEEEEEEEASM